VLVRGTLRFPGRRLASKMPAIRYSDKAGLAKARKKPETRPGNEPKKATQKSRSRAPSGTSQKPAAKWRPASSFWAAIFGGQRRIFSAA
jgi:hypothetical protein